MKQLQILSLFFLSVFSLNAHEGNTFNYREEFKKCCQSSNVKVIQHTINNAPTNAKVFVKRRALTMSMLSSKENPELLSFVEKTSNAYAIKKPTTVVFKVNTPIGAAALESLKDNRKDAIFIDQDFLLEATDEDLEIFIVGELNRLRSFPEEIAIATENK